MASLKLKVLPRFPAQVLGGDGIVISQSGGVYTIAVDPDVLPDLTAQIDVAHGGTGQDFSGSSGILLFTAGVGSLLASTGTGNVARATSPVFTTPNIGAATAGSINGNVWTTGTGTLTFVAGKTLTISNSVTLNGTDGSTINFGAGGTLVYTTSGLGVFAPTTSASLASAITDETGSGALVFGTSPTIAAPTLSGTTNLTGGQIAFPATQSASSDANTLDDYEEGSFTPALTFDNVAVGMTFAAQSGRYQKIGKWVYVTGYVALTAKGSSTGTAELTGLPFTSANNGIYHPLTIMP